MAGLGRFDPAKPGHDEERSRNRGAGLYLVDPRYQASLWSLRARSRCIHTRGIRKGRSMIIRRLIVPLPMFLLLAVALLMGGAARAQIPGAGGPPAVGVVHVQKAPITETSEFVGRIEATDRVALVARVTAFLDQRLFIEGSEVKKGDLLYVLERAPFQADLAAKAATVQQTQAQLANATLAFNRVSALLRTPAGQQSAVDDARATMLSDAAQMQNAEALQRQSQINLDYTEIRAPISGKIGRT